MTSAWDFETTRLSPTSLACIEGLGFQKPTAVQAATIPRFLDHKDVVVEAVTGSGKTLAFLLPIIEILLSKKKGGFLSDKHQVGALIISPTRELASQTFKVVSDMLKDIPELSRSLLIGGADVALNMERLQSSGCNIMVGTPGRILDVLGRIDSASLKTLEVLILDEADRLLSLGFELTVNSILEKLPKQRRTGLFSATMSDALSELVRTGLRNPVRITVKVENRKTREEQNIPESLQSRYMLCEYEQRLPVVLEYISSHPIAKKSIIYFGTCATVEYFSRALPLLVSSCASLSRVPRVFALHGRMEHKKREKLYQEYLSSEKAVLLCTDVAARGLDFTDVDLVVQYEAPQDPTTFVHRCGRTARVGRSGEALLILSEAEDAYVEFLANRKTPLSPFDPTEDELPSLRASFFEELRRLNSGDRDLYERSTRAFVAFVRFYQEHQAKFIFRLKDVDLASVAKSFGLLRLPKMKELKGISLSAFVESAANVVDIQYKDPLRNKQRLASFEALKTTKRPHGKTQGNVGIVQRLESIKRARAPVTTRANNLDLGELDEDWKEYKRLKKMSHK